MGAESRSTRRKLWFSSIAAAAVLSLQGVGSPERAALDRLSPAVGSVPGVPGPVLYPRTVEVAALPDFVEGETRVRTAGEPDRGPHRNVPHGLPIPPGAKIFRAPEELLHQTSAAAPQSSLAAALASPTLDASFAAIGDDGMSFPPDTNGGASASQVVAMLNTQFRIQDLSGNILKTSPIKSFWGVSSSNGYLTDPHTLYASSGHWIATILSGTSSGTTSMTTDLLLAVSQSSDATGAWSIYDVPINGSGETYNGDFDTLGYSRNRIVVQMNLFDKTFTTFQASRIFSFDRTALESGRLAQPTVMTPTAYGSTQFPAVDVGGVSDDAYLLEEWDGNSTQGGTLQLFKITGALGSEAFAPVAFSATDQVWADSTAVDNFAPQLGSTTGIATNTADFSSPIVYRNGSLWAAHTIFLPAGAPTRSAVQWWQLSTDGSVAQRGRLDDATGNAFYAYPSVAVDRNSDVLIGCARFSADTEAGAIYVYRSASDPQGTLRTEATLAAGQASYVRESSTDKVNRWGDYSATVVDAADTGFWTIGEYAAALNSWGTWWGHVRAEAPVAPAASFDLLPQTPVVGIPVLFHDTSAGGPTGWSWDFGDGTSSSSENPQKTYAAAGAYRVTLSVSNNVGSSHTSGIVTISPPPGRPDPILAPHQNRLRVIVRPG